MTEGYSVDLDQLDAIVSRLSGLARVITEHLTTLDAKTAAVYAGSWAGAAAASHQNAHREWASAATEFVDGITAMSTAARNAHTQYIAAHTANNHMFGRR